MKYSCGVSGAVALGQSFYTTLGLTTNKPFVSTYISVATSAGTITYVNSVGQTMIAPGFVGRNPIQATQINTSGTTAVGLYFEGTYDSGVA